MHNPLLHPEGWTLTYSMFTNSDSFKISKGLILQLPQGWKVHKLFLVVGNFNQGAARQGIKMKSHQLQPQHPSIIKALFRH